MCLQANGFVTERVGKIEQQSVKQQPVKIDTLKGHIYFAGLRKRLQQNAEKPASGNGEEEGYLLDEATGGADATASSVPSISSRGSQDIRIEVDIHETNM